jgi:hypothetical protein
MMAILIVMFRLYEGLSKRNKKNVKVVGELQERTVTTSYLSIPINGNHKHPLPI